MNILFITDDQHRYDFFDFEGRYPVETPNLRRLKEEGAYFPNTYSNCPICMPTRFTWQYGLYASQAGARLLDNHHNWPTHLPSLAQSLRSNGYQTALVGKLHSHAGIIYRDLTRSRKDTQLRGYDHVTEVSGRSLSSTYDCDWTYYLHSIGKLESYRQELANWKNAGSHHVTHSCLKQEETIDAFTCRAAQEYLTQYDSDKPFFLHLSFCSPHVPVYPSSDTKFPYKAEDMPEDFWPHAKSPEEIRRGQELLAAYATLVSEVDDYIGQILDLLQTKGILDDTLVVFGTDHGDMLGEHQCFGKQKWYEGSVKTPLLMRLPGQIPANRTCGELAESVDVPITLLDSAGIQRNPEELFPGTLGQSLWSTARGTSGQPPRTDAYSECLTGERGWRMLRSKQFKYIYMGDGKEHLFDLQNDPHENHDLADDSTFTPIRMEHRLALLDRLSRIHTPNSDGGPFPKEVWYEESFIHPSMSSRASK
ncbi:MAG: sulfatase family protein [Puniceicoccales bacterium]